MLDHWWGVPPGFFDDWGVESGTPHRRYSAAADSGAAGSCHHTHPRNTAGRLTASAAASSRLPALYLKVRRVREVMSVYTSLTSRSHPSIQQPGDEGVVGDVAIRE